MEPAPHSAPATQPGPFVGFASRVRSLRLSVTDRCNLHCRYCMPADECGIPPSPPPLPLDDLAAATQFLFRHLPLERVRITGGEPLVRRALPDLVRSLRDAGVREISMTTNGVLLERFAAPLKESGLARVNVSLDSLDPGRFAEVTRGGDVRSVIRGIEAALRVGLAPVKLNAVLRRSSWQKDVPELLAFAAANALEVRFIELMRTGTQQQWTDSEYIAASAVEQWLRAQGAAILPLRQTHGPARLTTVEWHSQRVRAGWITPRSHPFCSACDRLRIDSHGRIYRCLMDEHSLALASILQSDGEQQVVRRLVGFLTAKTIPTSMSRSAPMVSIGG